tara:strand:+ start:517 stop:762 length:246 start_codon:yes stop_codon:yes gene_type:complete
MSDTPKSANVLINRNNLNNLFELLVQIHLRGQLSRDEQAFVRNFIELPEAPTRENRQARRANTQAIKKLFREEAKKRKEEK